MAHTLAEVQVEKPADTLCDVKALALVDVLTFMLVGKKGNAHPATPREMWRLRRWSRRRLTD